MSSETALSLQRSLNRIRAGRLAPIPENGRPDETTRKALRAFQHEHNLFAGRRILMEKGQLDYGTILALSWWDEVLSCKEVAL